MMPLKRLLLNISPLVFILLQFFMSCYTGAPFEKEYPAQITVNAVEVAFINPVNDSYLSGSISVDIAASSPVGIKQVRLFLNGSQELKLHRDGVRFSRVIDGFALNPGTHSLTATAIDYAGFVRNASIVFHIRNDLSIRINSPQDSYHFASGRSITVSGELDGIYLPYEKVELWLDDDPSTLVQATIDQHQHAFLGVLSTSNLAKGIHVIHARVTDSYANQGFTAEHQITVNIFTDNLNVNIISPLNNTTVNGLVTIVGCAYAEYGIHRLDIQIDSGNWQPLPIAPSWQYTWNTNGITTGAHLVKVRCIDDREKTTYDTIVLFRGNVSVKIVSPSYFSKFNWNGIMLRGTASSPHAIEKVVLTFDNGSTHQFDYQNTTNAYWQYQGEFLGLSSNGFHIVEAAAYDFQGNVARDHVVVEYKSLPNLLVTDGHVESQYNTPVQLSRLAGFEDMLGTDWTTYTFNTIPFPLMGYMCGVDVDSSQRIYINDSLESVVRIDDILGSNQQLYNPVPNAHRRGGLAVDQNDRVFYLAMRDYKLYNFVSMTDPDQWMMLDTTVRDILDIEFNSKGEFYISNSCQNIIEKYTGYPNGTRTAIFTLPSQAQCDEVAGIAVDSLSNVYVNYSGINAIYKFSPDLLNVIDLYADNQFNALRGIDVDSMGRIYVTEASTNQLIRIDDMNGNGKITFGSKGTGIRQFLSPHDIKVNL